ncbi:MAG: hypothetical protein ACOZBG_02355 [Candidatus Micrarchaeota archaeon]
MDIANAFKSTFRIIFGSECNVQLEELRDYLWKYHYPSFKKKSSLSNKDVIVSSDKYCKEAKFVAYNEIDFNKKYMLNINEIKDIDSIIKALSDRFYYTGNKILGNSKFVEESDTIINSFYVKDSHNISDSKYMAYCMNARKGCEYCFGSSHTFGNKYSIHTVLLLDCTRCFESYYSIKCSDLFFTFNCNGTMHAMFSFNLRSKRYCIGNLELDKDKYFALRKKLVDESREYLEKNKSFYSIFEIGQKEKPNFSDLCIKPSPPEPMGNPTIVDSAFRSTCRIIFGKELGSLISYENYLTTIIEKPKLLKTLFGNKICFSYVSMMYRYIPESRLVNSDEANQLGKITIHANEKDTLATILEKISKIAFYCGDYTEGKNINTVESHWLFNSINAFRTLAPSESKNCSYSSLSLSSESIFGSYRTIRCKFCMNCHYLIDCARCFEVSDSNNCLDCYFCHNCENLVECMFCFNAKAKQYAIGNVEIGKEDYMKIKKLVLSEITAKLERDKQLDLNIYNLGCYCKRYTDPLKKRGSHIRNLSR